MEEQQKTESRMAAGYPPQGPYLTVRAPRFERLRNFDYGLRCALNPTFDFARLGAQLLREVPPGAVVFTEDDAGIRYAFFRPGGEALSIVGPYVRPGQGEEDRFCMNVPAGPGRDAIRYYHHHLYEVGDEAAFRRQVTEAAARQTGEEALEPVCRRALPCLSLKPLLAGRTVVLPANLAQTPVKVRAQLENELLRRIAQGDLEQAVPLGQALLALYVPVQGPETLREVKDTLVALNALCCKSLEDSGVDLADLDGFRRSFLRAVEGSRDAAVCRWQLSQILRAYCNLVRDKDGHCKRSRVQKVLHYIDLHFEEPLTLQSLAAEFSTNPSYLSGVFRREVGMTLTDYIALRRIRCAETLLTSTPDPIAKVAERVGMLDPSYFAKVFKKINGQSPTDYRARHRFAGTQTPE